MRSICPLYIVGLSAGIISLSSPSYAVIIYDSATRNTSAPAGDLADSGWQFQGSWAGWYLGTPIAPYYFITATHVGGTVGQNIILNGTSYQTTAKYDSPNSDLTIWKTATPFFQWAPMYRSDTEVGQKMVVFGRGTQRGGGLYLDSTLKGWIWGASDHVQSWGQNYVSGIDSAPNLGEFLKFSFTPITGQNEATLSPGDSGGAVFVEQDGVWKLAGINYGVDSPYRLSPTSTPDYYAAVFDQNGLYTKDASDNWVAAPNEPGNGYSTRISTNLSWIDTVVPEPTTTSMIASAGFAILIRRRR